ncbi:MAG: glycosyltransferase family 4 protein [Candidatus Omnitrophota bacterium]
MKILVIDKTAGLASSHERHQEMAKIPGVEIHVLGPRVWIENGRAVEWRIQPDAAYTSHFGRVFFKDYYARAGYYSGLCRALRAADYDIVQLMEEPWSISAMQTAAAASIIAPRAKILFYTWENIFRPWTYPSRASALYALIDKTLHRRSAAAVCASEGARDVLLRKGYTKPIAVIPYGIPAFFFEHSGEISESRPFTVGYIGRLLPMKGVDILLQAIREIDGARLRLIGGGEIERFQNLSCELGIQDRVEWIGSLSEESIPAELRRMDVLVLPSRRTERWMEQLGRAAIEAMAAGVPVIGANTGAIPEVLSGAGRLFEDGDIYGLAERIAELRSNPQERARLGEAGRQRAQSRFTWPRFAAEICEFYQSF